MSDNRQEATRWKSKTQLTEEEALDLYFNDDSPNAAGYSYNLAQKLIPSNAMTTRLDDDAIDVHGWLFMNVNGPLAFVSDEANVCDARYASHNDGEILTDWVELVLSDDPDDCAVTAIHTE